MLTRLETNSDYIRQWLSEVFWKDMNKVNDKIRWPIYWGNLTPFFRNNIGNLIGYKATYDVFPEPLESN